MRHHSSTKLSARAPHHLKRREAVKRSRRAGVRAHPATKHRVTRPKLLVSHLVLLAKKTAVARKRGAKKRPHSTAHRASGPGRIIGSTRISAVLSTRQDRRAFAAALQREFGARLAIEAIERAGTFGNLVKQMHA